jgi:hypothetical protein
MFFTADAVARCGNDCAFEQDIADYLHGEAERLDRREVLRAGPEEI